MSHFKSVLVEFFMFTLNLLQRSNTLTVDGSLSHPLGQHEWNVFQMYYYHP